MTVDRTTGERVSRQIGHCARCACDLTAVNAIRVEDADGQTVDSYGFVEFADELVCHICLGESWRGPVL